MNLPQVVGHQGSDEGVTRGSLDAFNAALTAGVDMVEVDVRCTRAGLLVACHEPTIGGIPVIQFSDGDVMAAGDSIVLVEKVVQLVRARGARLMLDLKDVGFETRTVDLARSYLHDTQFVISTLEDESVALISKRHPALTVGLSLGRGAPQNRLRTRLSELFPLERARRCGARFLSVHKRLARLGVLAQASKAQLPVFVWTVDEPREMRRFLQDPRVCGVITNYPVRALRLRGAMAGTL